MWGAGSGHVCGQSLYKRQLHSNLGLGRPRLGVAVPQTAVRLRVPRIRANERAAQLLDEARHQGTAASILLLLLLLLLLHPLLEALQRVVGHDDQQGTSVVSGCVRVAVCVQVF